MMDFLDVLRGGGWIADPADRVRVEAEHGPFCPVLLGGACQCTPRLVLREAEPDAWPVPIDAIERAV